jgi:dTMP kinase
MSGSGGAAAVEWIRSINRHALRPDLTIVLDVASDVAAMRREQRGEAAQLYEQNEVQRALAAFYKELPRHMPGDRIVLIEASGPVDEVHDRVVAAYDKAFA